VITSMPAMLMAQFNLPVIHQVIMNVSMVATVLQVSVLTRLLVLGE
jgi:hypothetical protein